MSYLDGLVRVAVVKGVRSRPAEEHDREISGGTENDDQRQEPQEIRRIFPEVSRISVLIFNPPCIVTALAYLSTLSSASMDIDGAAAWRMGQNICVVSVGISSGPNTRSCEKRQD